MKYAGGDLGLTSDSSVLAIADASDTRIRIVELVELRPRKGEPLRLSEVIQTFANTLRRYELREFMADGWSREPAREHASKEKIEIVSAPEGRVGKTETYLATRDAMREGKLGLPNNARLRAQMRSVIAKPVSGGGLAISSPRRGGHGDLVSAVVLAIWQAVWAQRSPGRSDTAPMPEVRRGGWEAQPLGFHDELNVDEQHSLAALNAAIANSRR